MGYWESRCSMLLLTSRGILNLLLSLLDLLHQLRDRCKQVLHQPVVRYLQACAAGAQQAR